jgi:hypothetical protein
LTEKVEEKDRGSFTRCSYDSHGRDDRCSHRTSLHHGTWNDWRRCRDHLEDRFLIGYNTSEGTYSFTSNGDGELLFADGIDICDIDYTDNADDSYVSSGDYLRVSNLPSGSVVTVWVLDATTGGMIVTKTWDLPG